MIFSIEPTMVSLSRFTGISLDFEYGIERTTFVQDFPSLVNYSNIRQLSYEPEKNIYHIIDGNGVTTAFSSVEESSDFASIKESINEIYEYFKAKDELPE